MSIRARRLAIAAGSSRFGACAGLTLLLLSGTPATSLSADGAGPRMEVLRQAQRIEDDGSAVAVTLPDHGSVKPGHEGPPRIRYQWLTDLPAPVHGYALYLPGLIAHAVVSVNGHVVADGSTEFDQLLPRGADRLVLLAVPDDFWRVGENQIDLLAAGTRRVSISPLTIGPAFALEAERRSRLLTVVILPQMFAAVMATLGLCMLLIWSRQREALYGYFGAGALVWALHSIWTMSPWIGLSRDHFNVWWTAVYGVFVGLLVVFCLRFAEWRLPRFERLLWIVIAAAPLLLYAGLWFDEFSLASDVYRMVLIGAVGVAVAAVARAAWRRRNTDTALIALTGLVSFAFALHDWIVNYLAVDNNPVFLVPYAGLLFVVTVTRMLVDRFVRASRQIAAMNSELERRVAAQQAELLDALERMRQARDDAETADRAKSTFLASASHDLRQPAHALGLYLAALRAEPLGDAQADLVQRMSGSLAALDTLFNALLDISRMDGGAVVPQAVVFALDPLLRRLADEFAPQAEARGLRLALRLPDPDAPAYICSDPLLIERIVRNLLANAVKYTARGGVLLACRLRRAPAPHWQVEVWDSGVGIAPAERVRIFEEFYQVGNAERDFGKGLGLGLAIVRRLTRLLGLGLELRSRPGRGSCFVLSLAAVPAADTPAAEAAPALAPAPTLAGMTVAMIEDSVDVRHAMRILLQRWGCRVIEGANAGDVLDQIDASGPPQVIVADFRLAEGRTGPDEVRALLTQLGFALPVLIVSGESSQAQLRAIEAAGHAYLAKPVAPGPLRDWLESAALPGARA